MPSKDNFLKSEQFPIFCNQLIIHTELLIVSTFKMKNFVYKKMICVKYSKINYNIFNLEQYCNYIFLVPKQDLVEKINVLNHIILRGFYTYFIIFPKLLENSVRNPILHIYTQERHIQFIFF